MGKNKRKRSKTKPLTDVLSWKPISVTLPSQVASGETENGDKLHHDVDNIEMSKEYTSNHYDDPKLARKAELDLPMNPGEDCGMFFGLEVLDASQYRVENDGSFKRLVVTGEKNTEQLANATMKAQEIRNTNNEKAKPETTSIQKHNLSEPKKKKKKKKNETKKMAEDKGDVCTKESARKAPQEQESISSEQISEIRLSWSRSSGGACLHDRLLESLHRLRFVTPTPIQAATLAAATIGRRNLVGAAPTGSGKTLAFLLPIFHSILQKKDEEIEISAFDKKIQALILTPTRELATQIYAECEKLVPKECVTLVGGIALVKQKRLLSTKRPSVVVATPGRLWAMLSSGDNDHLRDLSQIQFLVLDEADRMTQEHSFPQLVKILNSVNDANPSQENESEAEDSDNESDDGSRMLGLPGIRGEAQLTMLTEDILNRLQAQKASTDPERMDLADEEYYKDLDDNSEEIGDITENLFSSREPRVHRQTFVYSATLTLPFTSTKTSNSRRGRKGKKLGLDGGIAEILEKTNAMGETKIVDLSSSVPSTSSLADQETNGVRLPPGLSLEQIKCTQRHKDSHLYAYLMTTDQGSSGPCLVFCNSIAAVRRVGSTFQTLGFNVRILHAHMQQRARFKAVESLKHPKKRVIVVCTDVAARGLDIPTVSTVVHYDVARAVDTFVHRSGRTARGIGKEAIGSSLSLIAPAEDKAHAKIAASIGIPFNKVLLDGRLLTSSQERASLASKIYVASEMEQKTNSHNKWFHDMAKEADLDLDDDMIEDETNRPEKELQQIVEAKRARVKLSTLLQVTMTTQKFGKFLSTNSAAMQNQLKQSLIK